MGCPLLGPGFLKIALGYKSLFLSALRKLKNSSRRSGCRPVKSDARHEVSLTRNKRKPPRRKTPLRDRSCLQLARQPLCSVAAQNSIMVGPTRKQYVLYRRRQWATGAYWGDRQARNRMEGRTYLVQGFGNLVLVWWSMMKIEEMTSNYCTRWKTKCIYLPRAVLCASPAFTISRKIHLDLEGKKCSFSQQWNAELYIEVSDNYSEVVCFTIETSDNWQLRGSKTYLILQFCTVEQNMLIKQKDLRWFLYPILFAVLNVSYQTYAKYTPLWHSRMCST